MATSQKEDILSVINEDHLTCQICLSQFVKPKALKCLHSFCEACLLIWYDRNGAVGQDGLTCPTCRTVTVLPPNGVTGLSDNHLLKSLLDTCKHASATQFSKPEGQGPADTTNPNKKGKGPKNKGKKNQPKPPLDTATPYNQTQLNQIPPIQPVQYGLLGQMPPQQMYPSVGPYMGVAPGMPPQAFNPMGFNTQSMPMQSNVTVTNMMMPPMFGGYMPVQAGNVPVVPGAVGPVMPPDPQLANIHVQQQSLASSARTLPEPGVKKELPAAIARSSPAPDTSRPSKPAKIKKRPLQFKGIVNYAYMAKNTDELELTPGDVIALTSKTAVESGWLKGTLNGKTGLFPANHVTIDDGEPEAQNETEPEEDLRIKAKTAREAAALIKDDPCLAKPFYCDICNVKCTSAMTFEEHVAGNKHKKNLSDGGRYEGKASVEKGTKTAQPQVAQGAKAAKTKGNKGTKITEPKVADKAVPTPRPRKIKKDQGHRVIVNYPYTPNREDELQLEQGDIILLTSTKQVDAGWLRGTVNGKTGVFPENFVETLDDEDDDEDDDGPEPQGDNAPESADTGRETIMMDIPTMYIGRLLGKKGATIKQISNKSGAKLFLKPIPPNSIKPGILSIKGNAGPVQRAKEMVEEILQVGKKPVATKRSPPAPVIPVRVKAPAVGGSTKAASAPARAKNSGGDLMRSDLESSDNTKPGVTASPGKGKNVAKKAQKVLKADMIAAALVKGMDEKLSTAEMLERMEQLLIGQGGDMSRAASGRDQGATTDKQKAVGVGGKPAGGAGDADWQPHKYVQLELRVPKEVVGAVIGRHGVKIREIMERLKVDLRFDDSGKSATNRLCIFGTIEAAEQAKALVTGMVAHLAPGFDPLIDDDEALKSRCKIEMLIPTALVGRVIGKQGSNLAQIKQQTGAGAWFKDAADEKLAFKTLVIKGSRTSILKAEAMVKRMVPIELGSNVGSAKPADATRPKALLEDVVLHVHMLGCLVGIVLGKGWANVKEIEKKTGSRISLKDDDEPVGKLKTMVIQGWTESAHKAKAAVMDILSKIHVEDVELPSEFVNNLFRFHGKNPFMEICRNTGARILVVEALVKNSVEWKRISITGTNDAVKMAKRQLETKVAHLRTQSHVFLPPGAGVSNAPIVPERKLFAGELPPHVLVPKREEELFECGCCYDDEVKFEDMGACEDGHLFCRQCIRRYCEGMIGQGQGKFSCLTDGCDCRFPVQLLESVLSDRLYAKAVQLVQEEELRLAKIDNLVSCPHCVYAVVMPNPRQSVLHCQNPSCLKATCRYCKEPDHIPLTCDQVEKRGETNRRTFVEDAQTEAMVRVCFSCGRRFYKSDGCNKMTCLCGATMCYVCRAPNIDYLHFDRFAPGQRCPLYSDAEELHNRESKKAKDDATLNYPDQDFADRTAPATQAATLNYPDQGFTDRMGPVTQAIIDGAQLAFSAMESKNKKKNKDGCCLQ